MLRPRSLGCGAFWRRAELTRTLSQHPSAVASRTRKRRIRKLLALAGGDPNTQDPERVAAHQLAQKLAECELLWTDVMAVERIRRLVEG